MSELPGKLVYAAYCRRRDKHWFGPSMLAKLWPGGCQHHEWMIRLDARLAYPVQYEIRVNGALHSRSTSAEGAYQVLRDHGIEIAGTDLEASLSR